MAVNLINVSGIEGKTGTQLLTTSTAASQLRTRLNNIELGSV